MREYAKKNHSESCVISAQIEQEISELSDEEKGEYLESLGLSESGLDKIVRASYSLLGLMSYLTAGEKETRAWTIKKGTKPVPRHHRQRERFIPTSSEASSRRKW